MQSTNCCHHVHQMDPNYTSRYQRKALDPVESDVVFIAHRNFYTMRQINKNDFSYE